LLIYGTFVFGLFALSSIILGKFSSDPEGKIISAIFDTLRVYLFSGLAAFNLYVEKNVTLPENLLLYPFKEVWGTTKDIPKTDILPWINTGVWDTNVYTAFAPWYQSLGLYAAIIIGILLGFYYGIWFSFRQNLAVGFYQTFLCFPLLMLFFQE
ncbi:oligosaccharide repeat unit polymerase, partial [Escherichia coli]|nr:oligosaccharide repeat unit polymerase [Escherichia coli]